jgi:phosphoglycolate phosphatase
MRKYDTVIFDLDGTLLNTLEDLTDSVNHALAVFGYPQHTIADVCGFVGNGVYKLMERATPGGLEAPDFPQVYKEFCDYYNANCRNKTRAYNGIPEMIEILHKQKYKMAVVSNKNDAEVKKLCAVYFSEWMDTFIGSTEGVRKKPAPDTVFQAMATLDSVPAHTVYVGDSEVDLETAINAGIDCITVSWGFRGRTRLEQLGAAIIVDRPDQIPKLLENI